MDELTDGNLGLGLEYLQKIKLLNFDNDINSVIKLKVNESY